MSDLSGLINVADAHRYLSEVIGFEPKVRVAALGPQDWSKVTDFPVFGFPLFVDDDLIVVGSEPSPFFDGMAAIAKAQAPDTERAAMARGVRRARDRGRVLRPARHP
jgi:hypothetical protein